MRPWAKQNFIAETQKSTIVFKKQINKLDFSKLSFEFQKTLLKTEKTSKDTTEKIKKNNFRPGNSIYKTLF